METENTGIRLDQQILSLMDADVNRVVSFFST
jgi:hypothetical protein